MTTFLATMFMLAIIAGFVVVEYYAGKWWNKLKVSTGKTRYQTGFNFAMESLRLQKLTAEYLMNMADNPWDANEFDEGVRAGVRCFEETKDVLAAQQSSIALRQLISSREFHAPTTR